MNQIRSSARVVYRNEVKQVLAFAAMIGSVLLICQGFAWIGLPAFIASLIPLVDAVS